tara:strand:+ start:29 stop:280 length:252 start_codon:yes stop_codon:yes gene_type:complete
LVVVDFQAENVEDSKILIVQLQGHVIVVTANIVLKIAVELVALYLYIQVVVGLDGVVVQLQHVKSQASPVLVEDTSEYMAEVV